MTTTKLYLIICPNYDREKLKDFLTESQIISDWFYNMKDTLFIKSTLSAQEIGQKIRSKFGDQTYFITSVSSNYWGILPGDHWKKFDPLVPKLKPKTF
jgi:hypothetical protein